MFDIIRYTSARCDLRECATLSAVATHVTSDAGRRDHRPPTVPPVLTTDLTTGVWDNLISEMQ
jgi:hypothetical protein